MTNCVKNIFMYLFPICVPFFREMSIQIHLIIWLSVLLFSSWMNSSYILDIFCLLSYMWPTNIMSNQWLIFFKLMVLCYSAFHHCEKIHLKEEIFVLVHGYEGFSPWSFPSLVLGPVVRQNIMVRSMRGAKPWQPRSRERGRERDQGKNYPLRTCPQWPTLFS